MFIICLITTYTA